MDKKLKFDPRGDNPRAKAYRIKIGIDALRKIKAFILKKNTTPQ